MKKLIYQGSVKNLFELKDNVLFEYSERYSLFDWGEMPDHLERKGESLAMMGSLFFKALISQGIPTHYLYLANAEGKDMGFIPSRFLLVKNIPVFRPELKLGQYDYSFYKEKPQDSLVPLEVIFRFGMGKGSSLVKRIEQDPTLLAQWNLTSLKENTLLEDPLIDFSTKLEPSDRYLTYSEAKEIASLSAEEFETLLLMTKKVACILKNITKAMNLDLWDGKVEWAFTPGNPRGFLLVDSVGLDELRLEKDGISFSKEFLREFYRKTEWFSQLNEAKKRVSTTGENLRSICAAPPALPENEKKKAEALYLSFTNDLSNIVQGKFIYPEKFQLKNWPQDWT